MNGLRNPLIHVRNPTKSAVFMTLWDYLKLCLSEYIENSYNTISWQSRYKDRQKKYFKMLNSVLTSRQ